MATEIAAIISLAVATIAVVLTLWQNFLTRRALESQILLTLKQLAKEANYVGGVKAMITLKNYENYDEYLQKEPEETRQAIYDTVDFLNFIAHLVEDRFIPRQTAWNFYFHAYRIGNTKLLTWWLAGVREDGFQRFSGYERMCKRIGSISDLEIVKHDDRLKNVLNKV